MIYDYLLEFQTRFSLFAPCKVAVISGWCYLGCSVSDLQGKVTGQLLACHRTDRRYRYCSNLSSQAKLLKSNFGSDRQIALGALGPASLHLDLNPSQPSVVLVGWPAATPNGDPCRIITKPSPYVLSILSLRFSALMFVPTISNLAILPLKSSAARSGFSSKKAKYVWCLHKTIGQVHAVLHCELWSSDRLAFSVDLR